MIFEESMEDNMKIWWDKEPWAVEKHTLSQWSKTREVNVTDEVHQIYECKISDGTLIYLWP
jgi:hypothetical protein